MSLIGNVKWLIDLMVYFNQDYCNISFSKDDPSQNKVTMSNSTVLPVLISKVPRVFDLCFIVYWKNSRDFKKIK